MTGRCEPVSGGVGEWHWLTLEQAHDMGYQYLASCRPPRDPTNDKLEALWLRVGKNPFAYGRALLKGDY